MLYSIHSSLEQPCDNMNFLSPIQHPLFKCHHHPMLLFAVCLCFAWVKSSLGCSSTLQPKVNLCGIGNDDDDILSLTSKNRQVSIKSQASPASHIHCDWKIFNQDPESCLPIFKCDKFNMTVSPNCNQNYLEIVDTNDKVKLKFCGFSNHLKYKLKDKVYLEVKSRAVDSNSYFDCQVLCQAEEPQHDQDVSTMPTIEGGENSDSKCGQSVGALIDMKIVGGDQVGYPGKYPWQVMLKDQQIFFCGGALIHPRYVLTAGTICPDLKLQCPK